MGQLYSGEVGAIFPDSPTIAQGEECEHFAPLMTCDIKGASNSMSISSYGGVLAGSLIAEFVVLAVAMVIINVLT